ncbi:SpoIIE family protein phosphatase [Frankia sp. CIT1]|uniref:SpoIIE family protein phosphatase n=1 Tax=Frankia sp. CIT1 TaxID=2880974 RepID=UPI001EF504A0|nr:SpoIIE family protein phosphatase [Frankia sp. CIT1]
MAEVAGLRRGIRMMVALALVVGIATLGVAVYSAVRADHATAERGNRLDPAATTAAMLLADYVDQESSVRGYLITEDRSFLDSFDEAGKLIPVHYARLEALLGDRATLIIQLHKVTRAHEAWLSEVARPELAAMSGGAVVAARDVEKSVMARTRLSALRTDVTNLEIMISREQISTVGRVAGAQDLLLSSLGTAVFLVAVIVVTLSVVVRRWLLRPIASLRRAVNAVAAGRYDTRVPAVGPKELVELAGNVDAMRAQLVRLVRQNDRLWEALAQEGPAVVALRDALTPSTLHASGLIVRGRVDPAEGELAGDWFDSVDLPGGRVGVVVGDVSGHGSAAGVYALRLKQLLGAALTGGVSDPGAAIEWVVDNLGETDEVFATAVVAVVDPASGTVEYANAGHPQGLLLRRSGPSPERFAAAGVPAASAQPSGEARAESPEPRPDAGCPPDRQGRTGRPVARPGRSGEIWSAPSTAEPTAEPTAAVVALTATGPLVSSLLAAPGAWATATLRLRPGDALFIYTDGLTEARNASGEQFGEDRLVAEILRARSRRPHELLDAVFEAVRAHAPGRPSDDRTAIILARTDTSRSSDGQGLVPTARSRSERSGPIGTAP